MANKTVETARNKAWREANKDHRRRYEKNYKLVSQYGTLEQYNQMLADQDNKCKICKQPEATWDKVKKDFRDLAVDHCHVTGKVRGLLCCKCNKALGLANDNITILLSMVDYIKENS